MNKIILIGNLTRDPEMRQTDSGIPVCNFTLAVNKRSQSDHPEAEYFRVTAWRGLAEICGKYLAKGRKAAVTGTVNASAYIAQDGQPRAALSVTADDVEFLSPRKDGGIGPEGMPLSTANQGYVRVDDEEIPDF